MAERKADLSQATNAVNRVIGESPEMRAVLYKYALVFTAAYKTTAPKRTGHMRSTATAGLGVSMYGRRRRPVGTVTVSAYYAVWNLTGAGPGMHQKSTGMIPRYGPFEGHYTFSKISAKLRAGKYI